MPAAKNYLELYKRHSPQCLVHTLKKPLADIAFFFDCPCYFYLRGHLPSGQPVNRSSTGQTEHRLAEAYREAMLRQDLQRHKQEATRGRTLDECRLLHLDLWGKKVGDDTRDQHELVLDRLQAFCHRRNRLYITDLDVDVLEAFKAELFEKVSQNSVSTYMAKIQCFLKEAYRRNWIPEPVHLKLLKVDASYEEGGNPYEDEEVDIILAECLNVRAGKTFGYASNPKTFRLMCEVQLDIGLRISDTIQFDPSKMEPGLSLNVYSFVQQKSKRVGKAPRTIEAFLSDRLKQAIQDCEWMSPELPFRYGTGSVKDLGTNFYSLMQSVGERCGIEDCRPHRLRDTFAVRMLANGMTIDDLSILMGHRSVAVTTKHYGRWVKKRSERLERLVLMATADRQ